MDLERISTGNELRVSKERILGSQRVRRRKSKETPRTGTLENQSVRKRFRLANVLIPIGMLAGSVILAIPTGRLIANDVKENIFTREYEKKLLKYGDLNGDGNIDNKEKSAFYRQVFSKTPKSVDEMLQGIRAYNPQ